MNEIVFKVEEDIDGGFNAQAVGCSIFTEGDTETELRKNILDALKCHFDDNDLPEKIKLSVS